MQKQSISISCLMAKLHFDGLVQESYVFLALTHQYGVLLMVSDLVIVWCLVSWCAITRHYTDCTTWAGHNVLILRTTCKASIYLFFFTKTHKKIKGYSRYMSSWPYMPHASPYNEWMKPTLKYFSVVYDCKLTWFQDWWEIIEICQCTWLQLNS